MALALGMEAPEAGQEEVLGSMVKLFTLGFHADLVKVSGVVTCLRANGPGRAEGGSSDPRVPVEVRV